MDPDRWRQIESLYHAALARDQSARYDFLRQACASDPSLQQEVQSLLGSTTDVFLESPAAKARSRIITSALRPGIKISHYKLLEKLGEGGMGVVFKARDQRLQRLLGITVCAAAGDNGSSDGEQDGLAHVDFPASSPWVLACGGTRLSASNGVRQSEVVLNDGTNGGATGGGVSSHFSKPKYQASVHVPKPSGTVNKSGRGIPDVAAVADPETGYTVLVDGQEGVVGGTSAVAPLWAALIARCNQDLGKNLGWLHPQLYGMAAEHKGFHDITSGNNGAFKAACGWDPCTGLGTPDGAAIVSALKATLAK